VNVSPNVAQPSRESEEKQLCLSCLAPNESTAHFCGKCGAPLSSYAATGPFESLLAEGSVYRQAAEHLRRLVVVLGVWLIFGMMALGGFGLVVRDQTSNLFSLILGSGLVIISVAMIAKTTRNYLAKKKILEQTITD